MSSTTTASTSLNQSQLLEITIKITNADMRYCSSITLRTVAIITITILNRLTLCMLCNFTSIFVICCFFFQLSPAKIFQKKHESFKLCQTIVIRSDVLEMGPNCMEQLSADNKISHSKFNSQIGLVARNPDCVASEQQRHIPACTPKHSDQCLEDRISDI